MVFDTTQEASQWLKRHPDHPHSYHWRYILEETRKERAVPAAEIPWVPMNPGQELVLDEWQLTNWDNAYWTYDEFDDIEP